MLLTFILNYYKYSIVPSLFHPRLKTFLFCKCFPPLPSFSSSGLTPWIHRGLFTDTSEHIRFLVLSFFCFPRFSCWLRAVDEVDSCRQLSARRNSISYRVVSEQHVITVFLQCRHHLTPNQQRQSTEGI